LTLALTTGSKWGESGVKVLDDLMSSPYNIIIKKPLFEFDVENAKNMNVSIQIEYSLKEHIITDMLKSLPYTGLKQDGTLMVDEFIDTTPIPNENDYLETNK